MDEEYYKTFFLDVDGCEDVFTTEASCSPLLPSIGTKVTVGTKFEYLVQEVDINFTLGAFGGTDAAPHEITVWVEKVK